MRTYQQLFATHHRNKDYGAGLICRVGKMVNQVQLPRTSLGVQTLNLNDPVGQKPRIEETLKPRLSVRIWQDITPTKHRYRVRK